MRKRRVIRKGLAFGIVLALVAVVFAGVPMNVSAGEPLTEENWHAKDIFDNDFGYDVATANINGKETIFVSGEVVENGNYDLFLGAYSYDNNELTFENYITKDINTDNNGWLGKGITTFDDEGVKIAVTTADTDGSDGIGVVVYSYDGSDFIEEDYYYDHTGTSRTYASDITSLKINGEWYLFEVGMLRYGNNELTIIVYKWSSGELEEVTYSTYSYAGGRDDEGNGISVIMYDGSPKVFVSGHSHPSGAYSSSDSLILTYNFDVENKELEYETVHYQNYGSTDRAWDLDTEYLDGKLYILVTGYRHSAREDIHLWSYEYSNGALIPKHSLFRDFGGVSDDSYGISVFEKDGKIHVYITGGTGNTEYDIFIGEYIFENEQFTEVGYIIKEFNNQPDIGRGIRTSIIDNEYKVLVTGYAKNADSSSGDLDIVVGIYSTGEVVDELPDLSISSSDITFSNPNPVVDETVQIDATVHNIGRSFIEHVQLTTENYDSQRWPVFSPDGTKIGYMLRDDSPQNIGMPHNLGIMDADGSNQNYLLDESFNLCSSPRFSPDGKYITYSVEQTFRDIYVADYPITNKVRLTSVSGAQDMPAFSPDGTKIVYHTQEYGHTNIATLTRNGDTWDSSAIHTRLTFESASQSTPTFSPDGLKIVYSSNEDGGGYHDIWSMNSDGTNHIQLTNNNYDEGFPWFSPDGTKIIFDGNGDIWIINIDGSDLKQLTNEPFEQNSPAFRYDGKKIVYNSFEDGGSYMDIWELRVSAIAIVSFYDGDPESGGVLIGQESITVWGNTNSHASIDWTPTTVGPHDIYVRIENVEPGDTEESNNVASKSINVKAPISPIADAGPDQTVNEGDVVQFEGTGSYSPDATGQWTTKEPMPTPRCHFATAVLNNEIYAISGFFQSTGSPHNDRITKVEMYDPITNSWETKADALHKGDQPSATSLNGKIYFIGGGYNFWYYNNNDEYDPITNTWTAKTPMPTARNMLDVVTLSDKIYAIGGYYYSGGDHYLSTVEVYDPLTDSWSTGVSINGQSAVRATVLNNKIYAISSVFEVFDPISNTWTVKTPPPDVGASPLEVIDGKIYLIRPTETYIYDPGTDKWSNLNTHMQYFRASFGTATLANKIYIIGGHDESGHFVSYNEEYTPGGILKYEWDFDASNGIDWDNPDAIGPKPTYTYGDNGIYTVTLQVTDNTGATDTDTASVIVNNIAPTVNAGDDKIGDEPSTYTFTGSHIDPGTLDTHTYEWDFNYDGTTFDIDATGNGVSNTWLDDFDGVVALRVTDDDDGWHIDTCIVTVNNLPPTVSAGPDQTVTAGDTVYFSGCFTDPGMLDTHTIEWNFGDGTTTTGTLTPTHVYHEKGEYTVTLTVTDDDGGIGTDTLTITVIPIPVTIDIKPGSYPNSINLGSKGKIPVAILTTKDFDASDIDPKTVVFTGANPVKWTLEDIDDDGDKDLLLHFNTQDLDLDEDSTEATLTGKTNDGTDFEGKDTVNIVPKDKNNKKKK